MKKKKFTTNQNFQKELENTDNQLQKLTQELHTVHNMIDTKISILEKEKAFVLNYPSLDQEKRVIGLGEIIHREKRASLIFHKDNLPFYEMQYVYEKEILEKETQEKEKRAIMAKSVTNSGEDDEEMLSLNGNLDEIGNYFTKFIFNCKVKSGANLIDIKVNRFAQFISKHFKRSNGELFKPNTIVDYVGKSPENPKNKEKTEVKMP